MFEVESAIATFELLVSKPFLKRAVEKPSVCLPIQYWDSLRDHIERTPGATAFDTLNIKDTPTTRKNLLITHTRSFLSQRIPWLIQGEIETKPEAIEADLIHLDVLYINLHNFVNGLTVITDEQGEDFTEPFLEYRKLGSLMRHMHRSAAIGMLLYRCLPEDASVETKQAFAKATMGAMIHDFGRLITHDLAHDEVIDEVFAGIPLRKEITSTIHQPVPTNREAEFHPSSYDTLTQSIVRFCDLFGKINPDTGFLRETIEESWINSIERQRMAFLRKDSFYEGKDEADLLLYCHREALVLQEAVTRMKDLGINPLALLSEFNAALQQEGPLPLKFQFPSAEYLVYNSKEQLL